MAVGPHSSPEAQVPLQKGCDASPHGWLPSGTQPQYGSKSETGTHVRPVGQAPPHENGPPPHGGIVVVVVVGGGVQPAGPHASQQLACAPTQRGALQRDGSRLMAQRTRPESATRQHVTAPGRPHVDCDAHRLTVFTHSAGNVLSPMCVRITSNAQRVWSLWLAAVSHGQLASMSARVVATAAASPGLSPQSASAGTARATNVATASRPGAKRMANPP
jgi:hypothetical protein